jgi:hypothetical protein
MQQHDLIEYFITPLESSGIEYMITGSVAATFYGEPRLTYDIDMVIMLRIGEIRRFVELFPDSDFYCPPEEIIRIELMRKTFSHFNLIHHDSGYKADVYPMTGDQLHKWGFQARRRITIDNTLQIWLAPPEYVIVRKLQYFKEGGSQKHLSDIRKMLDTDETVIDHAEIERWILIKSLVTEWNLANNYGNVNGT